MKIWHNILAFASPLINLALLIVYIIQVDSLKKQIKNESQASKCAATLNALTIWTNNLTSEMTRSRKIVEMFNQKQCDSLYNCEKFKISSEIYPKLCERFNKKEDKAYENKEYELSISEVNKLRDDVIRYLNLLEVVLASRKFEAVDKDLIKQQFSYLVIIDKKESVLQKFRVSCNGKEQYPSIEAFCDEFK